VRSLVLKFSIDGPTTLNTLNKIASALGGDPTLSVTLTNATADFITIIVGSNSRYRQRRLPGHRPQAWATGKALQPPWQRPFPLIVEALTRLRLLSCIINGEAVACDHKGTPSFDRLRPIWWFDPARIALALPSANVCFSPGRRTPCNAALDRCRSQHLQL
jgi:hypothetical protein